MAEKELKYMQHVVGKGNPISYIELAEVMDVNRQTIYHRTKSPFIQWEIGELLAVCALMGWDFTEIVNMAMEYEKNMDPVTSRLFDSIQKIKAAKIREGQLLALTDAEANECVGVAKPISEVEESPK